ncbi:helix-turn-helix transcriptional regulator [Mesorhizobium loti]|nr:AlpA family phage regulatory protein [Mesorhizobium loti]
MKDAARLTSMSRTLVLVLHNEGLFPKMVKLGERRIAFVRTEVLKWAADKMAARATA